MYNIAKPNEFLAVTGMGIDHVKITKACWVWPFQRCVRFSVQPHDYVMDLQAMTVEKLQCMLPTVFTVGPDVEQRGGEAPASDYREDDADPHGKHVNRGDSLMKYATLLADSAAQQKNTSQFLQNIVKGIVEGEVRVLVSSMTMEELFTEREVFKRRIFRNIQSELDQFGLKIYNANVKELRDAPNSSYFANLSRKAHEGASNQARIDVAAAQLRGNVGEATRKGEQDREIAKINAETAVAKTERDVERASAEATLATRKTAFDRDVDIAKIEATRATEAKDEDLKKEVQIKKAAAEVERLRATDVVKATIARESKQQAADAKAYEVEAEARANYARTVKQTDGAAYTMEVDAKAAYARSMKQADGKAYNTRTEAEATAFSAIKRAEANYALKLKEAEGVAAMADAYTKLGDAFGGPAGLLQYIMVEKGTYVELAKANADAVRGMAPKISLWNTGAAGENAGANGNSVEAMRNVYQMLPPLMTTINEQTGITLPEWQFGKLNRQNGVASMKEVEMAKAMQNGVGAR